MIEVNHLHKQYGNHVAVSDLSFTVEDGKIYGLLGPNGAGKSTTMNIMTGCLAPTSGEVLIDGYDIFDKPMDAKKRLGYLPELPPVYPDMTPKEYLTFVARLKGVSKKDIPAQLARIIEVTQIGEMQNRLIKNLSKGYKQRVGIAQALLGEPQVIILDEPTVGLDPKQIIEIRDLIKSLAKDHTVILSSHILSEVQAVCDHIMIINKGELVASDTPENLEKLFQGKSTLSITVKGAVDESVTIAKGIEGAEDCTAEADEDGNTRISLSAGDEQSLRERVFIAFAKANLPILDMTVKRASLEDIFLEFTENESAAEAKKAVEASPETPADETKEA